MHAQPLPLFELPYVLINHMLPSHFWGIQVHDTLHEQSSMFFICLTRYCDKETQ